MTGGTSWPSNRNVSRPFGTRVAVNVIDASPARDRTTGASGNGTTRSAHETQTSAAVITNDRQVDLLFTMLPTPDAVKASALDADGFLHGLRPGSIWVNCGTVNPSFAREMAAAARSKSVRYVDAPVTGSKDVAGRGELLFLVGA